MPHAIAAGKRLTRPPSGHPPHTIRPSPATPSPTIGYSPFPIRYPLFAIGLILHSLFAIRHSLFALSSIIYHSPFAIRYSLLLLAVMALSVPTAAACTFCSGGLRARPTLRQHWAAADCVVYGRLDRPRFDRTAATGQTDLHILQVLKDHPALRGRKVLTLPVYLPVIGDTPREYLLFGRVQGEQLEPLAGLPASAAVVDYLRATVRLPEEPAVRLAFYFRHLEHVEPRIAEDAFLELGKASDRELQAAARQFDAAPLRRWIDDPRTPPERLNLYAFLLGLCGTEVDACRLERLLTLQPPPERVAAATSGILAGYILLDPRNGWRLARQRLADPQQLFSVRLAVLETVRFFQAFQGPAARGDILQCLAAILPHGDLADQAIEDLRRWQWWDLTPSVLELFDRPTHQAPIVRRAIVRYALSAPDPHARQFLLRLRQRDPQLVRSVEEALLAVPAGGQPVPDGRR